MARCSARCHSSPTDAEQALPAGVSILQVYLLLLMLLLLLRQRCAAIILNSGCLPRPLPAVLLLLLLLLLGGRRRLVSVLLLVLTPRHIVLVLSFSSLVSQGTLTRFDEQVWPCHLAYQAAVLHDGGSSDPRGPVVIDGTGSIEAVVAGSVAAMDAALARCGDGGRQFHGAAKL